jgi:hypothetical protein
MELRVGFLLFEYFETFKSVDISVIRCYENWKLKGLSVGISRFADEKIPYNIKVFLLI